MDVFVVGIKMFLENQKSDDRNQMLKEWSLMVWHLTSDL
jgi:hypothetical protein